MNYSRRQRLLEYLAESSPASIESLSAFLAVSTPTIRRDLRELESEGLVLRQHGMVTLPTISEPMFSQREKENSDLKKQIATHAASQIKDGSVIALDVGTTSAELAKKLVHKSNLTIFTASYQVSSILARSQNNVYLIGGLLRKSEMSLIGSIALDIISKFNFDRFYLSLAGISNDGGATDYSIEEAEIKRAFISRSREVIAIVDRTKIGKTALVKVCELDEINEVITNRAEDSHISADLQYNGRITLA